VRWFELRFRNLNKPESQYMFLYHRMGQTMCGDVTTTVGSTPSWCLCLCQSQLSLLISRPFLSPYLVKYEISVLQQI